MVWNPVFEGRPDSLQTNIDAFTTDPGLKGIFLLLGNAQEARKGAVTTYTRL
jgi:hypothetical protein